MTTGDALLAAVLAAPDDDSPRLIYADWLDENGQPEQAEFIRVQCELARLGHYAGTCQDIDCRCMGLARRERGLLPLFAGRWLAGRSGQCSPAGSFRTSPVRRRTGGSTRTSCSPGTPSSG
jgi:uncharacterized protein (TIGR02996 family)